MTPTIDLSPWIGATLSQPGRSLTELIGWREEACCGGQPDLYLAGRDWSILIDAPFRIAHPEPDVLEVWTWQAEPEVRIVRSSPKS